MGDLLDDLPQRPARVQANRENALNGKAVVARNALKHGLLSSRIVVAWSGFESEQDLDILRADLVQDLQPDGALEDLLVEKIAVGFWRLQRMWAFESARITEDGSSQTLEELRRRRASAEAEGTTASGQAERRARHYAAATDALRRAIAKLPGGAEAPGDAELCIPGALQALASAPAAPLDTTLNAPASTLTASYGWFRGTLTALDSERTKQPEQETMTALAGIAERMRERLGTTSCCSKHACRVATPWGSTHLCLRIRLTRLGHCSGGTSPRPLQSSMCTCDTRRASSGGLSGTSGTCWSCSPFVAERRYRPACR